MQANDSMLENPLKKLGFENDDIISPGSFCAVLARAGVGKTSLMVQVALNAMLRGKKVLHISLDDSVKKINLWYKEIFQDIIARQNVEKDPDLWESILPKRFIMTLKVDKFSVPKLERRLKDLSDQDIFSPDVIIIDSLPFDESVRENMIKLKPLAGKYDASIWFTIRIHRHEGLSPQGLPVQLTEVEDLFDAAILIIAEEKGIFVRKLKGGQDSSEKAELVVDPKTMLIES